MPKTLSHLLLESWRLFVEKAKVIAVAAVVFSLLIAASQAFFARQMESRATAIATDAGMTREELDSEVETQFAGKSFDEIAKTVQTIQQHDAQGQANPDQKQSRREQAVSRYVLLSGPIFFASTLASMTIVFVASIFFLVLAVQGQASAYEMALRVVSVIVPISAIWLWSLVRAFVWIPFVGFVTGAYFLPRFLFAPVIFLKNGKGVFRSVTLSHTYTRGAWLRIVGTLFSFGLMALAFVWVSTLVAMAIGLFSFKLALFFWLLMSQLVIAFSMIFLAKMGTGYMQKL